jgi:hypothetical protein
VLAVSEDDHLVRDLQAAAKTEVDRLDDLREARANEETPLPGIGEARQNPIVFGQHLRPKDGSWLSYYGGNPTVPADFAWPMSVNDPERPIHFLLQWDCRQLVPLDATGMLPQDGVLYGFQDYVEGSPYDVRFFHIPGPTNGWAPKEPPAALGPFSGMQYGPGCTNKTEAGRNHMPKAVPRWTFEPIAIPYRQPEPSESEDDTGWFWRDYQTFSEDLLKAQFAFAGPTHKDERPATSKMERPFPRFPHDWAAVRIIAADALERASSRLKTDRILPDLDEAAKAQLIGDWTQQAEELFAFAAGQPSTDPVPAQLSDDIWAWCETLEPVIGLMFDDAIKRSVNLSLGLGSAALDTIPDEWVERVATWHALARDETPEGLPDHVGPGDAGEWPERLPRKIHAPTPNRLFGPPSYVQGYVEDYVLDHLLLLEMSSSAEIGFELGDGVVQCMIRPEDLKARRFDRVMVVSSSY